MVTTSVRQNACQRSGVTVLRRTEKMGIYKRKDPNGHFVAYKAFRDDPEANPLKTPSGKIEIYSSKLAEIARPWELEKDEVISPLPVYASTFEGWDSPERRTFPLQLFGFHYKSRTHSTYGNIDLLKAACRQEVWINPIDAQKRGIANGDMVRVFNHRGEVRLPAKVTPRILPGVSAMGQEPGTRPICLAIKSTMAAV